MFAYGGFAHHLLKGEYIAISERMQVVTRDGEGISKKGGRKIQSHGL